MHCICSWVSKATEVCLESIHYFLFSTQISELRNTDINIFRFLADFEN